MNKTYKLTIEFDNKRAAERFLGHWIDGGGDGGGNIDWDTTKWDKKATKMRVKGSGCPIRWEDDKMIIEED